MSPNFIAIFQAILGIVTAAGGQVVTSNDGTKGTLLTVGLTALVTSLGHLISNNQPGLLNSSTPPKV
jgi:hypothetical protein